MMTNLIAKPIVKNQLWVIVDGDRKIGNVEADSTGYSVKIGSDTRHYADTKSIERIFQVEFEKPKKTKPLTELPYALWPTEGPTYNNFYDVKRKIHVYTTSEKSSCYHAAGYFRINMNGTWETIFCPKYIFVQRYEYSGPHNTLDAANNS
jgi:hypothetical protein